MKNNGKLTAAFIIVGLLALAAAAGAIALIWYAGDFERYLYDYQIYLIAVAAAAVFTFILACCFAAGLSGAYRKAYAKLAAKIDEAERAAVAAAEKQPEVHTEPVEVAVTVTEPVAAVPEEVAAEVTPVPATSAEPVTDNAPETPDTNNADLLAAIGRIQVYAAGIREFTSQDVNVPTAEEGYK